MSRKVRMVPADWQHPLYGKDDAPYLNRVGKPIPLNEGYEETAKGFMEMANAKGLQEAVEYYGTVDKNEYMPDWPEAERTHLMMYETTSEGTPISPAFATPEELARWLADNNASAFGSSGATYDQWLAVARGGWAPSAVMVGNKLMSGVEFQGDNPA